MKHSTTVKIVASWFVLQAIQSYFPVVFAAQLCVPSLLSSIKTAPFFFIGLFTHMFSHGGWDHLISNATVGIPSMLYLEHRLGSKSLLRHYVLFGLVAAIVQACAMPYGNLVGASGAIMGCIAADCMLLGNGKGYKLPYLLLGIILIHQLQGMLYGGNIAYAAHIGGILAGVVLMGRKKPV